MCDFIRGNKFFIIVMVLLIFIASRKFVKNDSEVSDSWILPVKGVITQEFEVNGVGKEHHGIDIGCGMNSRISVMQDGVVEFVGNKGVYGLTVMVKHNEGFTSLYGHNSEILVRIGDKIKQGDIIANSGSSGVSTGPHAHVEIRRHNICYNPLDYINKDNKPNQVVRDSKLDFDPEEYLPSKIDGM